jgi:hypothetical protein
MDVKLILPRVFKAGIFRVRRLGFKAHGSSIRSTRSLILVKRSSRMPTLSEQREQRMSQPFNDKLALWSRSKTDAM